MLTVVVEMTETDAGVETIIGTEPDAGFETNAGADAHAQERTVDRP